MQSCRRHQTRFYAECPTCKQELFDTQRRNEQLAAARRLVALIPAHMLAGTVQTVIPVGDGAITVEATPDSEWGQFEVTGWMLRPTSELEQDQSMFPGADIPVVGYTSAHTVQDADSIPAAIADATQRLTERLDRIQQLAAA
jgi:hypothetical protein